MAMKRMVGFDLGVYAKAVESDRMHNEAVMRVVGFIVTVNGARFKSEKEYGNHG
jgi:hypothetical protein